MLTAAADHVAVLASRDLDSKDDTVLESSDGLLQFSLELGHQFGLSTKTNFVGGLTLTRAAISL